MSMPFYVSPEQMTKDRADYARKGIARGRALVACTFDEGILLCAENPSRMLRKISEIYDRIGFAGVGKYNEFDQLRIAGVRHADLKGFSFSREDVDARSLANQYAQMLGQVFTHEMKPMEVEILVAEVGANGADDQLFHILYDGTVVDERRFSVLGGDAEAISARMNDQHADDQSLDDALIDDAARSSEVFTPRYTYIVPVDELDGAIISYMKRAYNLLIGERTAEEIKFNLGSAYPLEEELTMEVKGRDSVAGLPKTIQVTSQEIREALADTVAAIVDAVRVTLERCPPELSADLVDRGFVMAGGGALIRGIDKLLSEKTGLPVTVSDDPLSAVANGTGAYLENKSG